MNSAISKISQFTIPSIGVGTETARACSLDTVVVVPHLDRKALEQLKSQTNKHKKGVPVLVQQYISGFHISMSDALTVQKR